MYKFKSKLVSYKCKVTRREMYRNLSLRRVSVTIVVVEKTIGITYSEGVSVFLP